jgi:xylose isomerase
MSAFPDVPKIKYEGPDSKNPLAYRHYNPDEVVDGKTMRDHLRFAVCYWHTFRGTGSDPFGPGCAVRPWEDGSDSLEMALKRVDAAFEFMEKLGVPFYCFHDRDVAPEGANLAETNKNLDAVAKKLKEAQQRTGIKLLWGTANLFSNKRFMHGASTSPNADVFAYSAAQVKKALEVTKELGGENYVFWGGREGYHNLYNTDLRREFDHLAKFLHLAVEYKNKIGFKGQFLIEPKPKEPTKHQYDYDVGTIYGMLKAFDLEKQVKINIEQNHAILAGHTFEHELQLAAALGILGSIDINRGDYLLGWDTDQFAMNIPEMALACYAILKAGGLGSGGFNFDAKIRRQSIDPDDLLIAHVESMDACARGLLIAEAMIKDGKLAAFVEDRYAGWNGREGKAILAGKRSLDDLSDYVLKRNLEPEPKSGKQEYLEGLLNRYV